MTAPEASIQDISRKGPEPLLTLSNQESMLLPCEQGQRWIVEPLTAEQQGRLECSLDGVSALGLSQPGDEAEKEHLVRKFLDGVQKLLSREDNWTFWQPLMHSLGSCVRCQNCAEACPIYVASGRQEIYRPSYRSEVFRRIVWAYAKPGGKLLARLKGEDITLNWEAIARLAELAYRCTLCRRCAQSCPLGVDNGLIARELRKLFSQEMGISPHELHDAGSVKQLREGASTGISPAAFKNIVEFMEDDIEDLTGKRMRIPVDREGADMLLIHNSGEFLSWIENPEAFAIVFEEAGVSWTLSSELYGYEATNYGVWYDDVQFARIALKQMEVARRLNVRKVVVGECGHAHKSLIAIADRMLVGDVNIPRESFLPLLEELVFSGRLKLNPARNDFPVTLHDPCNLVRLLGIVEPQRRILKRICPQFREMSPHGVENYCCGGGSGFAIMAKTNFPSWKMNVAGRTKLTQIIDAFRDVPGPRIEKYVCAPCSNCKAQIRDLLNHHHLGETNGIRHGGLMDLVANALEGVRKPFFRREG
jgi:Fe-S oxidoreductase